MKRNIPFGRPIFGDEEKAEVIKVLDSGMLVHGKKLLEFEAAFARFAGAPHAVAVSSCTAALHLAYFQLGLGPGDEVVVPAQTHTATAHAVELTGAKPVFVDAERRTGNMDLSKLEAAISPRTKALSLVHFLGMPVDMDVFMGIARKHGLFVVEDCALATGTYYKGIHAGLFGDLGCYSFYPAKHMTTSEGGILISRHEKVAKAATRQRAFGMDKHVGERKVPGIYDVEGLGFNYRMSEMQAAIGVEQLKRLPGFLAARERNYLALAEGIGRIPGVTLLASTGGDFRSSYYCFTMLLEPRLAGKRIAIIERLNAEGVGTSVYYPSPVPKMTYYRNKYGFGEADFPVATWISGSSIALPVGPHLADGDVDYMIDKVRETLKGI